MMSVVFVTAVRKRALQRFQVRVDARSDGQHPPTIG
jgi:hypothetical protein